MPDERIAILGLPDTGKSTYLGALWHMVEEPSIPGIKVSDVKGVDLTHVQTLADLVRGMEKIERTKKEANEGFRAPVQLDGGKGANLTIPDRSGEQFRDLVELRHWPVLLADELEHARGAMLFIHPDEFRPPLSLRLQTGTWEEVTKKEDYSNKGAATVALLIDGLENILDKMDAAQPVPLAVVVSALDRIPGITPGKWIRGRMPALDAFLRNNPERIKPALFGVSALGGRLQDADEVVASGDVHERVWAQDADGADVSFEAPVLWALGW